MRFYIGKTPKQRAREQLATRKERERLERDEGNARSAFVSEAEPTWRRIDQQGVADQQAEIERLKRVAWTHGFAGVAGRFVGDVGGTSADFDYPEALPEEGPFEMTITTDEAVFTFYAHHHGKGRVTFKTNTTGDAEYEVDLREDWEKTLDGDL